MIVHFLAHISKCELVCKFGVIFDIFLIISCLGSWFHAWNQWFFYSIITFSYSKYFVHSYIVDVVFTLSYWKQKKTKFCWIFCLVKPYIQSFIYFNDCQWKIILRSGSTKTSTSSVESGKNNPFLTECIWLYPTMTIVMRLLGSAKDISRHLKC